VISQQINGQNNLPAEFIRGSAAYSILFG